MADPVQRDGEWWQETKDGRWLVWDPAAKRWDASESPPPPPSPAKPRSPLLAAGAFALSHWTTLFASAGLLVYAVVRVAHDEFYGAMAVTAEEVGLDHTLILSRAALYLFLYGLGIALLIAISQVTIAPRILAPAKPPAGAKGDKRGGSKQPSRAETAVRVMVAAGIFVGGSQAIFIPAGLTTSDEDLPGTPSWLVTQETAIVTLFFAIAFTLAALVNWVRLEQSDVKSDTGRYQTLRGRQPWLTLVAASAAILAAFSLSGRYGFIAASDVKRGVPVVPFTLSLLSVHADPVCVEWLDQDVPEAIEDAGERPFMYLGQANGLMILYDNSVGAPLRLPAGKAFLEIAYPEPTCSG